VTHDDWTSRFHKKNVQMLVFPFSKSEKVSITRKNVKSRPITENNKCSSAVYVLN